MIIKKTTYIAAILAVLVLVNCSPHIHIDFLGEDRMEEVVLIQGNSDNKILVIDVNGPIATIQAPGVFNREGDLLSSIYSRLNMAARDPNVRGIILRLDTPGGEGTASDIIYNEINRFRKRTGVPVTAMMMSVAASGGYYIACACDTIVAHPSTITGSIGVIAILPGFKTVLEKIGITVNVIKSGKMKDAGSPFKDMSDEDRSYFQNMIDSFYRRFLEVVHQNRKDHLSMDEIEKLADGRVYSGDEALKQKLVDHTGYFQDAIDKTKELAKITDASVIAYTYYPKRKTNIYANAAGPQNPVSLDIPMLKSLVPQLKTGIYYLWMPGPMGR